MPSVPPFPNCLSSYNKVLDAEYLKNTKVCLAHSSNKEVSTTKGSHLSKSPLAVPRMAKKQKGATGWDFGLIFRELIQSQKTGSIPIFEDICNYLITPIRPHILKSPPPRHCHTWN